MSMSPVGVLLLTDVYEVFQIVFHEKVGSKTVQNIVVNADFNCSRVNEAVPDSIELLLELLCY